MAGEDLKLIRMAEMLGYITDKQAAMLIEEITMFAGTNPANVMLRRNLVTPEQLLELKRAMERQDTESQILRAIPLPGSGGDTSSGGAEFHAPANPPSPEAAAAAAAETGPGPGHLRREQPVPVDYGRAGSSLRPAAPAPQPSAPSGSAGHQSAPPAAASQASPVAMPPPPPGRKGSSVRMTNVGDRVQFTGDIGTLTLKDYLAQARTHHCSDLHISPYREPFVRLNGSIVYSTLLPLTPDRAELLNFSMLTPAQTRAAREHLQLDFPLEIPGVGRHRCNVYRQRHGWEGAYRLIPDKVPTMDDLGLPTVLRKLTEHHHGLIMVTGPGGSGKTTTVAAMLDFINEERQDHIITVEDPVEYVLLPKNCQVTQRAVGNDTETFASALRAALRQDPDVILVGELRDYETTSIAITASETGHLVFGTLHTSSAARTVSRIMEVYPPSQRQQIVTMVAESMRGVVSQQLIPRRDGKGRALAAEVLIFTTAIAAQIKEGKTHQIPSLMQSGKRLGMRTMDESIMELLQQKVISGREAYVRAENKQQFEAFRES